MHGTTEGPQIRNALLKECAAMKDCAAMKECAAMKDCAAMKLRQASVSDVETLFDIRCSVRENFQSREELADLGITLASVRDMLLSGDYVAAIADIDDLPVGFSMAQISERYVFACFVRPEYENQGVGRALMNAAEEALRRKGVTSAWLSTGSEKELRAPGFYRHLGWSDDGFLDDGQIRFAKSL